jgi:hypothetical protein
LIERNLAAVERKLGELSRLRRELRMLAGVTARPGSTTAVCSIIEAATPASAVSKRTGRHRLAARGNADPYVRSTTR